MVIIPARPGVFDVNAVQETIQTCRSARKPYAVVINGAPAERDGVESRIVTIAREALAKFRAPVWSGQITNRADLLMALSQGEGAREYYAEGRAAAEIGQAVGRDRTLDQGDPRNGVGVGRDAQAGGVTTPHLLDWTDKERAGSARFSLLARYRHCLQRSVAKAAKRRSNPALPFAESWIASLRSQ